MSEPDKRCGTCRHWGAFVDESKYAKFKIVLADDGLCSVYDEPAGPHDTCEHWEARE